MSWMQLSVDTSADATAQVEELLLELGALSITLLDRADQPLLEPAPGELPLWQQVRIQALFEADTDPAALAANLQRRAGQELALHWQTLPDQDWERAWMADFQPRRLGRRLWVCPSWCPPPEPDAINLLLDPGLAFGTGTHATTALCLEWLDSQSLEGVTVLDYGCGSGILAIAALLLGAETAVAVDHDPQALTAPRANAEPNGIPPGQLTVLPPDALPGGAPACAARRGRRRRAGRPHACRSADRAGAAAAAPPVGGGPPRPLRHVSRPGRGSGCRLACSRALSSSPGRVGAHQWPMVVTCRVNPWRRAPPAARTATRSFE